MSEIEKGCTFNHRDGFPEQELAEVKAENARLKEELLNVHKAHEETEKERTDLFHENSKLKAALDSKERRIERLEKALTARHDCDNDGECFQDCPACQAIKEALAPEGAEGEEQK